MKCVTHIFGGGGGREWVRKLGIHGSGAGVVEYDGLVLGLESGEIWVEEGVYLSSHSLFGADLSVSLAKVWVEGVESGYESEVFTGRSQGSSRNLVKFCGV